MPISRSQFDKAVDKMSEKVIQFLKAHPGEAFEISELAQSVGGRQMEVQAVLDELKHEKVAKRKCIKGKSYYCIGRV
jgi:predicted transcriptional regulator